MRLIKIGIGNVDPTVGAFKSNVDQILAQVREMAVAGCHICAFGELSVSGYPCEDTVQWPTFVDQQDQELDRLVRTLTTEGLQDMVVIVGLTVYLDGELYNVAAVIAEGRILGFVPKENLPNYGVFYEGRTISPGRLGMNAQVRDIPIGDMIFEFAFGKLAVEVCEDIWRSDGPMVRRSYSGAEVVVNISASPFRLGAKRTRREMISTRAADNCTTVVYVNLVGAQDSLVFAGGGYVNQCGRMLMEAEEGHVGWQAQVVDLDRVRCVRMENTTWRRSRAQYLASHTAVAVQSAQHIAKPNNALPYPIPKSRSFFMNFDAVRKSARQEYFEDLEMAISLAAMGYFQKTGAFKRFLIALSGGKDSVLTLLLTHKAVSKEADHRNLKGDERAAFIRDMILCVDLPSRHNTSTTRGITQRICENLDVTLIVSPIQEAVEVERRAMMAVLETTTLSRQVEQNIQARVRGERMQNLANECSGLWLQTSNMSEKAVGYTTIGGDMMGAYALIANLPKTVIVEFIRWYWEQTNLQVIEDLLKSKASAELEEGQEDERDLMPFPVLDASFALFVGEKMSAREVLQVLRQMWTDEELRAMDPSYMPDKLVTWTRRFIRLFFLSIFKWVQTPLSVHLGNLDLERERALQLPVVQDRSWAQADLESV